MTYPDPILVIHNEITDYPGSFTAVWALTGQQMGPFSSDQMLRNKVNPHSDTHKLTLKEAIRLQQAMRNNRIAEVVANAMGGSFVPHCKPGDYNSDCIISLLLRINKTSGAIGPIIDEALDDDYIDARERAQINESISRLETKLARLKECINGRSVKNVSGGE